MLSLLKYTVSDTTQTRFPPLFHLVKHFVLLYDGTSYLDLYHLIRNYLYHLSVFILKASQVHAISLDGVMNNV